MGLADAGRGALSGNFGAGGFSGAMGPLMDKFKFITRITWYIGIVGVIGLLFYKLYIQYRDRIEIFITDGSNNVNVIESRCMIYKDKKDGTRRLKVLKRYKGMKLDIPFIVAKLKYHVGKNDKYFVWMDQNMELQPSQLTFAPNTSLLDKLTQKVRHKFSGGIVKLSTQHFTTSEKLFIQPRPQDRDAWRSLESKKQRDKLLQESFWDKHGAQVIQLTGYAIAFLIFYFGFQELSTIGRSVGNGLQAVATQCLGK